MEVISMTGKFHLSWGDFGGFKHPNALRYESAVSLANGAKICVGDQMHPFGKLDPATYKLIGQAFAEVEPKEPWCRDVTAVADVGVLTIETFGLAVAQNDSEHPARFADSGALRVLQEGGVLYDFIDPESDFSLYQVLVLPDAVPVDAALKSKLEAYLARGGRILASGESALDADRKTFALDFGLNYRGETAFNPCYIAPHFPLASWEPTAFVIYSAMKDITPTTATVLADRQDAFFNRDFLHFCSHKHTPSTQRNAGAAMVRTANTVYIAFNAFSQYALHGQCALRDIILHGLRHLLTRPTLQTNLPSQAVQTVQRQESERRTIVHLIYGSPIRRGRNNEIIEDLVPLRDVSVALRVGAHPKRVYLAPQNTDLPFQFKDGLLTATVPTLLCHQMVVVE
jgi:hypothetical protein